MMPVSLLASMTETSARTCPAAPPSARPDRRCPRRSPGCSRPAPAQSGRPAAPKDARSPKPAAGRSSAPRARRPARRQRQRIGLGPAGGEGDFRRIRADQRRDLRPRLLDRPGGRRGPRHGPRTDFRSVPAPPAWPRAPAAAAARSRSSPDRRALRPRSSSILQPASNLPPSYHRAARKLAFRPRPHDRKPCRARAAPLCCGCSHRAVAYLEWF